MDRLSHGKRSIAINLKEEQGLAIAKKLSSQADVIIEPFRAGTFSAVASKAFNREATFPTFLGFPICKEDNSQFTVISRNKRPCDNYNLFESK